MDLCQIYANYLDYHIFIIRFDYIVLTSFAAYTQFNQRGLRVSFFSHVPYSRWDPILKCVSECFTPYRHLG